MRVARHRFSPTSDVYDKFISVNSMDASILGKATTTGVICARSWLSTSYNAAVSHSGIAVIELVGERARFWREGDTEYLVS
jgi:hypothetical protein